MNGNRLGINMGASTITIRLVTVFSAAIYSLALYYVHVSYLAPVWGYYGFELSEPTLAVRLLGVGFAVSMASVCPAGIDRPSSLLLSLLLMVVCIPTVIITLNLEGPSQADKFWLTFTMTVGFVASSLVTRSLSRRPDRFKETEIRRYLSAFVIIWCLATLVLFFRFYSIIRIAGLDEIYVQRELGSLNGSIWSGYLQIYYANVFSPVLLIIGLKYRRVILCALGAGGCLLSYGITAMKTTFVLPFAIIALHIFFATRLRNAATAVMLGLSTLMLLITGSFNGVYKEADFVGSYYAFRTIGIPALTLHQYYLVFSREGFTRYSHVKGVNWLIDAPDVYKVNPKWPQLGYIVSEYVYGSSDSNTNANPFASDGAAACGYAGILLVSLLMAAWMVALDRLCCIRDKRFVALTMFPVGLALTNVPLFTTVASFGGGFWLFAYTYDRMLMRDAPLGSKLDSSGIRVIK